MPERKSKLPLILGLLLVVVGCAFLLASLYGFQLRRFDLLTLILPALLLWLGLVKLVRHFTWEESRLLERPRKAGLLGGLFWTCVGFLVLLECTVDIDSLATFGLYWPVLLILFGLGKIVDFYRLSGTSRLRVGEFVGILFIVFLGFASGKAANATLRPISFILSDLDIPSLTIGGREISVAEFAGMRHRWESEASFSLEDIQEVEIANRHGDVHIHTEPVDDIRVRLTKVIFRDAEAEAREIADRVQLTNRAEEATLRLGTNREDLDSSLRFRTHWVVQIPDDLPLRLQVLNAYGDVQVAGSKAPCNVRNSHGDVEVSFMTDDVTISNRYRMVSASEIQGNLKVENRRGRIRVEDVHGDVEASNDHSSISAENIQGDFSATNRAGRVRLETVSGAVRIEGPGSTVRVSKATGPVRIENSQRRVRVIDVAEGLELDTSFSRVELGGIEGDVVVRSANSEITGEHLNGAVTIQARSSAIDLEDITGRIDLATSLRRVAVSDFRGAAEVQNEYGDILLAPETPLAGMVSASNRNGRITLVISPEASFKLSAQTAGGRVVSDFRTPGIDSEEDVQALEYLSHEGRPEIRLQTTYSEIRIVRED